MLRLVSKLLVSGPMRTMSPCRSGRSPEWLKSKNPACEAVRRGAEEDWGMPGYAGEVARVRTNDAGRRHYAMVPETDR